MEVELNHDSSNLTMQIHTFLKKGVQKLEKKMNELDKDILKASLEYLYWFSRFEYTLKENNYLQHYESTENEIPAKPNWKKFRLEYEDKYSLSENANKLINLSPKKQIAKKIDSNWKLNWTEIKFENDDSELYKIITLLQIVRNNLFHGGKHHSKLNSDKERDFDLIKLSTEIIKEIAYIEDFGMEVFEPYQRFDIKKAIFST
jgi:hypothetical protein